MTSKLDYLLGHVIPKTLYVVQANESIVISPFISYILRSFLDDDLARFLQSPRIRVSLGSNLNPDTTRTLVVLKDILECDIISLNNIWLQYHLDLFFWTMTEFIAHLQYQKGLGLVLNYQTLTTEEFSE